MDFDGDGKLDLISGSYDPGELYLFRGQGGGKFAARETITDETGKPVVMVPDQKDRVESFGSWVAMVDWDDDGDLDLLVGSFGGMMFVRQNVGTRTKPLFSAKNEWVMVSGKKKLRVPGGEHANPVIADWDGDGRWDIITGAGDGGVYWYRNVGDKGRPEFAVPVTLVPKHEGIGYSELLDAGQEPKPGIRSQIAVVDYRGDGKLAILLGDFCTYLHVRMNLSADERRKFDNARKEWEKLVEVRRRAMDDITERFKQSMKDVPKSDWNTKENQAKWQTMYKEFKDSDDFNKDHAEMERLQRIIKRSIQPKSLFDWKSDPERPSGYVWLFERR